MHVDTPDPYTYISKSKGSDTTRNNTAVLANDPDLIFTAKAGKYYNGFFLGRFNIKAASDLQFAITGAGVSTAKSNGANVGTVVGGGGAYVAATAEVDLTVPKAITVTAPQILLITFPIMIEATANGGQIAFQWAQNTAAVEDTILYKGAMLRLLEI